MPVTPQAERSGLMLRCTDCGQRPADLAAVWGGHNLSAWCELCAGPNIAQRVFHYTVYCRPLSAFTAEEYERRWTTAGNGVRSTLTA